MFNRVKKIKFGKFASLFWSVVFVQVQRKGNGMRNEIKKQQNNFIDSLLTVDNSIIVSVLLLRDLGGIVKNI